MQPHHSNVKAICCLISRVLDETMALSTMERDVQ
jgi:hypothetical protein